MGVVDGPVRRLDDLPVTGPLKGGFRCVLGREQMDIGMQFVRAGYVARSRHGHRVVVSGATFGRREVIPIVAPEQMRALDQPVRTAAKDVADRPDQPLQNGVVLLQHDAGKGRVFRLAANAVRNMIPDHVEEPFATVIVVEQRRVETARIDVDRIRPWSLDRRRGDNVVVRVLEIAVEPFHVRVDKPEQTIGM